MKVQKAREMDNKKGPSIETIPTLYMRGTMLRVHAFFFRTIMKKEARQGI
jgi:hypothetical protein